MAHFAKLDSNNIVTAVHIVNNNALIKADGTESELKGKNFLNSLYGPAEWVQTSYNGNFRKNYAGVGYKYDITRDAFIPPKPFDSWILNETTCVWESSIPRPVESSANIGYAWDEANLEWVEINL